MPLAKCKRMIFFSLLVMIWPLLMISIVAATDDLLEYQNIFVQENILIGANQTIGKLLVANGTAVVAGVVKEGIIVVDGNVIIQSGAVVHGRVIVIGGEATIQQGTTVKEKPWVIRPQGQPLVPLAVGAFFLFSSFFFILLPLVFWLSGHLVKKAAWYPLLKEQFLAIQRRWPGIYIAVSLGISAFMLTSFAMIAWKTIFRKNTELFDNIFIWLVRYFASPNTDKVMMFITDVGFGKSYGVILVLAFFLLTYYRRWREMAGLGICLAGGGMLNFWLKYLFQRGRPELLPIVQATGYSFPSGHVIASMCFYGMAAFLIIRTISSWRGRLAVMTFTGILIVLIASSRVYLGVHYPTDVAAGFAAGSMWVAFCVSLLMWWEKKGI